MPSSFFKSLGFTTKSAPDALSDSITIAHPTDALYALWRKPETLPVLMSHFATITILNQTDSLWRANTPLGALLEWRARIEEEKPGEAMYWRSLPGALVPNEGRLTFSPALNGEVTVTLWIRFTPPGGLVGRKVGQLFTLFSRDMLKQTLERFKKMADEQGLPPT